MNDEPIMLIDLRFKSDVRIKALASRLGMPFHDALGRLLCVWQLCYQNASTDVHAHAIDMAAEHDGFASAMLRERLATHRDEGFLYVHGSHRAIDPKNLEQNTEKHQIVERAHVRTYVGAHVRAPFLSPVLENVLSVEEREGDRGGLEGKEGTVRAPRKTRAMTKAERQPAMDAFVERYVKAYSKLRPKWTARDVRQIDDLIRAYGTDEVVRRIHVMFDYPPEWMRGSITIGFFVSQWNLFVMTPDEVKKAHASRTPAKHGRFEPKDGREMDTRTLKELTDEERRR